MNISLALRQLTDAVNSRELYLVGLGASTFSCSAFELARRVNFNKCESIMYEVYGNAQEKKGPLPRILPINNI